MQSEHSDEEAVSGRRATSCLSAGSWLCANTEKSFHCSHSSSLLSPLQCSSPLYYSSPLLHFLAHHPSLHFSCWLSIFFAFKLIFIANSRLCHLLNTMSVFSKHVKNLSSLSEEDVKTVEWAVNTNMTAHG